MFKQTFTSNSAISWFGNTKNHYMQFRIEDDYFDFDYEPFNTKII